MIAITCPCGRQISVSPSRARRKKYCSKKCFYKYRERPSGLKYKLKVKNPTWFKKGNIPWIKGKKGIIKANTGSTKKGEHRSLETEFQKGDNLGEKNSKWKGKDIGYFGLHTWFQRKYGKANCCENRENNILNFKCSERSTKYDWALIRGKRYERKRESFIMLCHSCHLKYDEINKKR